ncbi:MAG: methyl-accepting chemotaxis protein [Treponema sp.]|jgi:methyl-accepting chemotaxis protein|nr:methyl-accepting chemotaxis protein [Treponema sp.]
MKIGVKLVTTISIFNLIGIGVLVSLTLLQSHREITRLVNEEAKTIAEKTSEQIGKWFETSIAATRTLAQVMEGYKDMPLEQRRDQFNFMLRQVLMANPNLANVYGNWSPNGLDGMDGEYVHTPGADESGRFVPLWSWHGDEARVSPITTFDWKLTVQLLGNNREYMLEPTVYPGLGNRLFANMGTSIQDKGALVGAVGCTLELSTIQDMVSEIKAFGDGSTLLFSSGGIVAAHPDPSRLGKNMRESESDTFGPFLDTAVDAVTQGTAASFSYRPPKSGTVMQYYAVPFSIGFFPKPWTVVVGVSQNTIMAPVYRMLWICFIIGLVSVALISLGIILTARSISRPLKNLASMLKDISEGEGDLTKIIDIRTQDEIGELAHYFNLTITKIKRLIINIKQEILTLSRTSEDLAGNMTETAASINEITANIQSITAKTGKQAASVQSTDAVMGEMVENIQTLTRQIEKQTNCINESSSAVEQMLGNIKILTERLVQNEANVSKLSNASKVGYSSLQEVSVDIQEIARESAGLLEINGVMENIASQTNLLSMNAAIEAAHAGEAGKGFAVVADEIRKLAESSSEQSKTISDVLKKIKDSIDKITSATGDVLQNFEAISDGVKTVTEQETDIRRSMEEQGTGSKAILESIRSLNELSGEVKQRTEGMLNGSHEVIRESKALGQISGEIGNGMQEMASGVAQINTAANRVQDISGENHRQIEALIQEVSRFKVD